jgi:preprotein translocase subunit SecD
LSKPPTHGFSFVIEADFSQAGVDTNNLAKLEDAIQKRASKFGAKIFWEPISESRVRVMTAITDAEDAQAVSRALFSGGLLEFKLVHPDSDKLVEQGEVPAGYQLLKREETKADGSKRTELSRRLAIVMDGRLYSTPVIQSPIETGRGQISGSFSLREAVELATALDSPLPVRVTVVESKAF